MAIDVDKAEREILISLLERCLAKIFADDVLEAHYFASLYSQCFPFASTFIVGKNPKATLRWVFRSASLDAHVRAITQIAFPDV
jgi:hypothetical protein